MYLDLSFQTRSCMITKIGMYLSDVPMPTLNPHEGTLYLQHVRVIHSWLSFAKRTSMQTISHADPASNLSRGN